MNSHIDKVKLANRDSLSELMLNYALLENWHYSLEDVEAYLKLNSNGISTLYSDSKLIGCISIYDSHNNYLGKRLSSVGLFLIIQGFRGQQKYGPALWEACVESRMNNSLVCLNSVARTRNYYHRLGLYSTSIVNSFFRLDLSETLAGVKLHSSNYDNIQFLNPGNSHLISLYDKNLFNVGNKFREVFFNTWLMRSDAIIALYIKNNQIKGYGIATICFRCANAKKSYRISPFYADTPEVCEQLFRALIAEIASRDGKTIDMNCHNVLPQEKHEIIKKLGFNKILKGDSFLMVNDKEVEASIDLTRLQKIIALSPLEFPHEALYTQR